MNQTISFCKKILLPFLFFTGSIFLPTSGKSQIAPLNFKAALNPDKNVLIDWTVSNEINHPTFNIEHSLDGKVWQSIETVQSRNEIGSIDAHTFTHLNPGSGNHQYRLRQAGVTGQPYYSEIRIVNIKDNGQLAMWPNPAKNQVRIQGEIMNGKSFTHAKIFDQSGKQQIEINLQPGVNDVNISSLKPGMYVVQAELPNGKTTNQKLLKQ